MSALQLHQTRAANEKAGSDSAITLVLRRSHSPFSRRRLVNGGYAGAKSLFKTLYAMRFQLGETFCAVLLGGYFLYLFLNGTGALKAGQSFLNRRK